ncbi:signal peptidase II [Lichenihabitans psoromatis]|uniref:signal peptidase II n=1 Tax=Lichenihabitans psoromatis TaxID=2528642 RepID=UPI0010356D63|nr:signal peptidase II [Lichenihabitans psoromatis]
MPIRVLGLLVALAALAADQASKLWLLFVYDLGNHQPVRLLPFLDLVLVWNRGISYSLFTTDSERGRVILLAVTLLATAALVVWLFRVHSRFTAAALGLLIGGALGNAYDRFAYGAVADFVWFHARTFSWYIFNGADIAIVIGVILLIYESIFQRAASKMP